MNYKYENVDELFNSLIGIDYSNYVDSCIINESCKKVIKDLQSLYNCFLVEYKKFNDKFELTEPSEIFTLFDALLYRGYLSYNQEFNADNLYDHYTLSKYNLLPCYVLSGLGVCRHTSALLSDILSNSDIENKKVICLSGTPHVKKYNLHNLSRYLKILSICGIKNILSVPYSAVVSNHVIVKVTHNDKNTYLDSINDEILISDENDKFLLKSGGLNPIKYEVLLGEEVNDCCYSNHKEVIKDIARVLKICLENEDILASFYNSNQDLYAEVNDKVRSLKI